MQCRGVNHLNGGVVYLMLQLYKDCRGPTFCENGNEMHVGCTTTGVYKGIVLQRPI